MTACAHSGDIPDVHVIVNVNYVHVIVGIDFILAVTCRVCHSGQTNVAAFQCSRENEYARAEIMALATSFSRTWMEKNREESFADWVRAEVVDAKVNLYRNT